MEPEIRRLSFRRDLLTAGISDDELRRLHAARQITSVRPGAYVAADDKRLRDPVARHLLSVRAAAAQLGPRSVISHASAAVVHGLPLWSIPPRRVHVTRAQRSGGRRSRLLHVHAASLEADEIVVVDGLLVTSVARTVVDLARTTPLDRAVVPADQALRKRMVTRADLQDAVERSAHRRGNTAARRLVAFADECSESPGESRSRVAIARAGLPPPVLQQEIYSAAGVYIGRVDFWWAEYDTVGEFDGAVKYGRSLKPGQDPGEVVFAEKRREDALRRVVTGVARWVWDELDHFDAVVVPRIRGGRGCAR